VDEVGVEALMDARAAVFMVFYEKVGEYQGERGSGGREEEGGGTTATS
jgi:ubiquitin carboxyl-terminal hydrolase 1